MRVKPGLRLCWSCREKETYRRIDGVPICDKCLIRDTRAGKVKDYTDMKAPKPKRVKGRFIGVQNG